MNSYNLEYHYTNAYYRKLLSFPHIVNVVTVSTSNFGDCKEE